MRMRIPDIRVEIMNFQDVCTICNVPLRGYSIQLAHESRQLRVYTSLEKTFNTSVTSAYVQKKCQKGKKK